MEKQLDYDLTYDLNKITFGKSDTLKNAPSILFIGFCSTGGGHTDREFNVVRSVIDRSFHLQPKNDAEKKQQENAQKCLTRDSVVIFVLPPTWVYQPKNYFPNALAFLQELRDPKLGLHVIAVQGTKTAASVYAANGGRAACLRLHARFPFLGNPNETKIVLFEKLLNDQTTYYKTNALDKAAVTGAPARAAFEAFRNTCPAFSMMDLVPQAIRAGGDNPNKVWGSTDMDFALTRALQKWKVPGEHVVDHESLLNLFVENPYACKAALEYCYMAKVLPSNVKYQDGQPVIGLDGKPLYISKTAHISLSTQDMEGLKQPNTLIKLRAMVKGLVNRQGGDIYLQDDAPFPVKVTDTKDGSVTHTEGTLLGGGAKLRQFAWNVLTTAGRQMKMDEFATANADTPGGLLYGKPLKDVKLEEIKGFIYLYLMDATTPVTKHIVEELKKPGSPYHNVVFALCAGGGIIEKDLPDAAKGIKENTNMMMYCNLMGGDAVMQAGMGTSSEFAYSVVNGCRDSRLLVYPMKGQDEHTSNGQFITALFPKLVTQINATNYAKALDDLVTYRQTNPMRAYGVDYVRGILNEYTISDLAADILLDDKPLEDYVDAALINVSDPHLKVAYRVMKICVQMLDQLEGEVKKLDAKTTGELAGGTYPYKDALNNYKDGQFIIALRRHKKHAFKDTQDATKFFQDPDAICNFLEIDRKLFDDVYKETLTGRVVEALQPGAALVPVCARYALEKISDIVKMGV